jgi:cytochrome P450
MQTAQDLELPELPLEEPSFAEDPAPRFAEARERHPWLARWTYGYVVTDYEALRDLFRMEDRMRNQYDAVVQLMGAEGTAWGRFQKSHLLNQSGAAHKRMRDTLAFAFTPRQANLHRGLMRQVISDLLDLWVPKGAFDFEAFASQFPISVMYSLIGVPLEAIPRLQPSLEAMGMSVSMVPSTLPAMDQAVQVLDAFAHEVMAERRSHPRAGGEPDLLDILLQAQDQGGLSDRELADILIFLFVAGYDTSKNALTLTMWSLIRRPEIYQRCGEDLEYCEKVVEESFRYQSVIQTSRIVTDDLVYRDVVLPKGSMLWFPLSIAARDPSAVEDPDAFRPERIHKNGHVAFGLGPHICLGQYLARAQIAEGLHQIARRIRNPRSPGPNAWRPFPGIWGIKGLPIEFDSTEPARTAA